MRSVSYSTKLEKKIQKNRISIIFRKKYLSIVNWPSYQSQGNEDQPKLSWCPYIQGEDEDEETIHMIAVYLVSVEAKFREN